MGALRCGSRLKPPAPAWQGRPSPTRPIRKGCSEEANNRRHGGGNRPSGNDVGRQLVLEPRELVAQQQLAFLEPLDLELVGLARRPQRLDRRVEITVLLSQPLNLSGERGAFLRRQPLFIVVHPCPFYARPAAPSTPPLRRGPRTQSPYAEGRRTRPNLPPKCRGRERVFHRPALSWRLRGAQFVSQFHWPGP